jgi:hypothetical protein
MPKLTLESLARRVEALERALKVKRADGPPKDWRRAVGTCSDAKFMRRVDAEGKALREAERAEAARAEPAR